MADCFKISKFKVLVIYFNGASELINSSISPKQDFAKF